MFEAALEGLVSLLTPTHMGLIILGVCIGTLFAVLPGIGALAALALTLPFTFTFSPHMAIALLLGICTVSNTGNTFSSVLLSVPGGAGSQATILDGYPMARKGEASRALSAAFVVSLMGAFVGAAFLVISLPILRPVVLALGSPELFMLCLWGVLMVGALSRGAPLKGIAAGMFGLLIASIGMDTKSGTPRFLFGQIYLWEGISLVIVGLGFFALPEMISLAVRRTSIAERMSLGGGFMQGIKDAFRHWWLMVRSSIVGIIVGVIPGLGSSVADWFAYSFAVQTEKHPENFGKGDIRGVIAPESSNNAKEGGGLIPTLAFGIPGSTSMALLLIVFYVVGIKPGPEMLTTQLALTFSMVWTLVIANIFAAAICLILIKPLAKICFLPFYTIVPVVIGLAFISAFSATNLWEDMVLLMLFGGMGFIMRELRWPRPPMVIGIVLGQRVEKYLWFCVSTFGTFGWLLRPGVIIVFVLILLTVIYPIYQGRRPRREKITGRQS